MYPTFSDMLKDLFGFYLPLPIQTFGFFVALAFLAGAWVLSKELKRRERLGWLSPVYETRRESDPPGIFKIVSYGSLGFFIGYKLGYIVFHWTLFAMDSHAVLALSKGNLVSGFLVGVLFLYLKYRDSQKKALTSANHIREEIWPHQRVGAIIGIAAIWGFAGAKLFDALENWGSYMEDPWGSFLSFSGLTYYGGLIMAAAGILWYTRKKEISGWHLGVYPTSVYEFILCWVLFLALWSFRKKIKIPGLIFGIYLVMNGTERFFIELIRVNNKYVLGAIEFTQAELISLILLFSGFAVILLKLLYRPAILTKPSDTW